MANRNICIPRMASITRIIPASDFEAQEEKTSAEKEPLYIPAPISEQIDAAGMQPGDPVTILTTGGFCDVQTATGKLIDLAPCSYAQYSNAGKIDLVPTGKRKGGRMYFYPGKDTVIYRGILPAIPESLKYIDVSSSGGTTTRRVRFMGADYRDFLRDCVRYYADRGYTPAVDTFQR